MDRVEMCDRAFVCVMTNSGGRFLALQLSHLSLSSRRRLSVDSVGYGPKAEG